MALKPKKPHKQWTRKNEIGKEKLHRLFVFSSVRIVYAPNDKSPMFVKRLVSLIKASENQVVLTVHQVNNKVVKLRMTKVQAMNNKVHNYLPHRILQLLVQPNQFRPTKRICYVQRLRMFHMFDSNGRWKISIHKCKFPHQNHSP